MRRNVVAVSTTGVIVFLCVWYVLRLHQVEPFNSGADMLRAMAVLRKVQAAEKQCYQARGEYVTLQNLAAFGCGELDRDLIEGIHDGLRVEVHASGSTYSIRVLPVGRDRFYSLYSDQGGVIRYGFPGHPATAESPPIGGRRVTKNPDAEEPLPR